MKKILSITLVIVLFISSYSIINAMPVKREYTDNIQRSIVNGRSSTNLANNRFINVNQKTKADLNYIVGTKYVSASYSSSNTSVATVNSRTGLVYFKKAGKVYINVKGTDKRNYRIKYNVNQSVFISVSIKRQTASIYRNGKRLRTAKVVTGRAGVTPTPKGTFKIAYKQRNTYLDGSTVGYDYYLAVKYWMPIAGTGGVGFHDASWRGYNQFGGKYYLSDGSHGCINMRTKDAAFFYSVMKPGTTVKIY